LCNDVENRFLTGGKLQVHVKTQYGKVVSNLSLFVIHPCLSIITPA